MKSMIRGVAIGLAVALGAQAAHAQAGLSLGVGGGVVVPTGSLADGTKTGWNGTLSARVTPATSPVGFQLDGFYNRFGFEVGDGNARMIGGTANAVYALPGAMAHPYLIGGIGVYNSKVTGAPESATKFGFNAGLGVDVGVGPAKFYAEGRLHAIMKGTSEGLEEKTAYMIPLTVGLRWSLR